MGWLRRPTAAETAGVAADGGNASRVGENESPITHDSPALAEVFASVDEEHPVRILDLGPATSVNLEYYSRFASGVRIAHLLRGDDLKKLFDSDDGFFVSLLDRLSPTGGETFGLILTWDLLDYLTGDQPTVLAHHLAAVADHGARIHAMTSIRESIPAKPTIYEISESGRLTYRPTTDRCIPGPNTPPAQVEQWLDPFRITRSVLLRHGVREFIGVFNRRYVDVSPR